MADGRMGLLWNDLFVKNNSDAQLTLLIMVIIDTFNVMTGTFVTWSMYIHFCFIRGCQQIVKEQLQAKQRDLAGSLQKNSVDLKPQNIP